MARGRAGLEEFSDAAVAETRGRRTRVVCIDEPQRDIYALALRAAQNVGMDVPKEAIEKAVAFTLKCFHKDAKGFAYQPGGGPNQGLTGVGVYYRPIQVTIEAPAPQ